MVGSFRTPLAICALLVSTSLSAQMIPVGRPVIPSDPAHAAAIATPLGALPPALTEAMYEGRRPTFGVQLGYGYVSSGASERVENFLINPLPLNPFPPMAQRSLGVTIGVPAPGGAFAATLGFVDPECGAGTFLDCDPHVTYGALWETAIVRGVSGDAPAAARFTLGLTAAIGYARTESPRRYSCSFCELFVPGDANSLPDLGPSYSANLLAISAGLPISVSKTSGMLKVRPFLIPGITYGRRRVAGDLGPGSQCSSELICTTLYASRPFEQIESSARLTVGGGLAVSLVNSPLTARLGFQQIFAEKSKAQLGLALSWQAH